MRISDWSSDVCSSDLRIYGISIRELDQLRALGVDFRVLSERGVEIFFKQTFVHNFFHADMHPGNIFVDASDPARPSYLAVDFGIVGTLTARSEEHTSELQSLMRISYAVLCLNKKTHLNNTTKQTYHD